MTFGIHTRHQRVDYGGLQELVGSIRASAGGYPVYIQQNVGYGEALIVDEGYTDRVRPAVVVNGPTYLMLRMPELSVWEAIDMWIRDKVIEPMTETALLRVDTTATALEAESRDRASTRGMTRKWASR